MIKEDPSVLKEFSICIIEERYRYVRVQARTRNEAVLQAKALNVADDEFKTDKSVKVVCWSEK